MTITGRDDEFVYSHSDCPGLNDEDVVVSWILGAVVTALLVVFL